MLQDPRIKAIARILIQYSLNVQPGQLILISGSPLSEPLVQEAYREVLRLGAHPEVRVQLEELSRILYAEGSQEQIEHISPLLHKAVHEYQGFLNIKSECNTKSLAGIAPETLAQGQKARGPIMQTMMERSAKGQLSWCGTQFPTTAVAQEAQMSLHDYTEFVFQACLLQEENPLEAWMKIHDEQETIIGHLQGCSTLRFLSQDTDLTMNIEGRHWVNCDGKNNFPDGEIFTGPVEDSVEGHIRFSFPGIYMGRDIEDIRLHFEKGEVVKGEAGKGQDLLQAVLNTDKGARYVGEAAVGTNYGITRFTRNMLFDEKIGGTIHLALGNGYPETGSKNKSSLHWDLLCDMREGGEIYADGNLIYKEGAFIL